ncbi:MAG: ectonucleotide pyrophosphatase/phosphodiesterase [Wenzhouxiangellaceae bacterium]
MVSIDGLRPEFYLEPQWPAPTLQRLAREGSYARQVRPAFPSVTYPNHTSMVTGAWPARHGIHYNSPFNPQGDSGEWYWHAEAIRAPTLWQRLGDRAVTAAVGWPVSVGAAIDYNLPEVWTPGRFDDFTAPLRQAANPPGLLELIEREATGRWTDERIANDHPRRDLLTANAVAWLMTEKQPALTLWHLIALDHAQHQQGRDGNEVREALAAVDTAVGLVLDHLRKAGMLENSAIIVTGDHGFLNIHTRLAPNALLRQAGLLDSHQQRRDWRAAFLTTGASAFLHLRQADDEATLAAVQALLAELPAPQRDLFQILSRDELRALGSAPDADLALTPKAGIHFTSDSDAPWRQPVSGGQHGNLPDNQALHTGLVVWGRGVHSGVVAEQLNITDIAPLAAALLGHDFEAPDGVLPAGLVDRAAD